MSEYVIEMLNITKEFPGIKANDDVTCNSSRGRYTPCWGKTARENPP